MLSRFPDHAGAILSGGRASHDELIALVSDPARPHSVREAAIDALVRDLTFDFGEPWRTTLRDQFPHKIGLLFGTRRYTRDELLQISNDPAQSTDMRRLADIHLSYGHHHTPAPASAD